LWPSQIFSQRQHGHKKVNPTLLLEKTKSKTKLTYTIYEYLRKYSFYCISSLVNTILLLNRKFSAVLLRKTNYSKNIFLLFKNDALVYTTNCIQIYGGKLLNIL